MSWTGEVSPLKKYPSTPSLVVLKTATEHVGMTNKIGLQDLRKWVTITYERQVISALYQCFFGVTFRARDLRS